MSKLYSFPLRQPSTTYGMGEESNGLTLIDHILSANPHPNQNISGGGASDTNITDRYNQHVSPRTQAGDGTVTDSPHLDTRGNQLFAGSNHNHDSRYAALQHNHDELYAPIDHTHSIYVTRDELYGSGSGAANELDMISPSPVITYYPETEKVDRVVIDYNQVVQNKTYLIQPYQYDRYPAADSNATELATTNILNGPVTTDYPHELRMIYGRSRDVSAVRYHGRQTVTTTKGVIYLRDGEATVGNGLSEELTDIKVDLLVRVNGVVSGVVEIDGVRMSLSGTYTYDSVSQVYVRSSYPRLDVETGDVLTYLPFPNQLDQIETLADGTTLVHPYLVLASMPESDSSCLLNLRYVADDAWLHMDTAVPIPAFTSELGMEIKFEAYNTYFSGSPLLSFVHNGNSYGLTLTADTTRTYRYSVSSFNYGEWQQQS